VNGAFLLHRNNSNTWLSKVPRLKWKDIELLDFFAVEPTAEDFAISHSYEVERNGLRLLFTVWQLESVIQASVFRCDADDALFTFAAYVRDGARLINDKRGRYLEIADCIIAPNRFWNIDSGNPFDREGFPVAVTITVAIDPDIQIAFVNYESRT
jgi:hypothetical protein